MRLAIVALSIALAGIPANAAEHKPAHADKPAAATTTATTTPAPTAPAAPASQAAPPPPHRIIGSIVSFTAPDLTVKTAKGETITLAMIGNAKIISNQKAAFNDIKPNDFISATITAGKDGRFVAKDLRIFPDSLRGLGEGQYPAEKDDTTRINATVAEAISQNKGKGGTLKLTYYGANGNPFGACTGHAAGLGRGVCKGESEIVITPATSLVTWELGDPSWLETGKAISLYAVTQKDGKLATYGVIVEHGGMKPLP